MSKEIIQNWIELSEYDYQTAKVMLDGGRYLYVAFTCQQSVEKLLKAIYVKTKDETPPYTHNLKRLVLELPFGNQVDEDKIRFLEELNSYYIESRYTETVRELGKQLDTKTSKELYSKTGEFLTWLRNWI
jgi:HEPN domain-containing protein